MYSQLKDIDKVQQKRKLLWNLYFKLLQPLFEKGIIETLDIPYYSIHNAHIFSLVCKNMNERINLISFLKSNQVQAVFHYQALHDSLYFKKKYVGKELTNAKKFENCLVRLPLYYRLSEAEVSNICKLIETFYKNK